MITVTLEGNLAHHFFGELEMEAKSIAGVLGIINANFPNYRRFIADSLTAGVRYAVKVGHSYAEESQAGCPISKKVRSITITPVLAGASGGWGKALFGAVILGIGIASGGVGFLGVSSSQLMLTGGVMLGTSLLGMLFGRQKAPKDSERDGKKSLMFDRPPQTELDGGRYPIAYGWPLVGLYLLSVRQRTWLTV